MAQVWACWITDATELLQGLLDIGDVNKQLQRAWRSGPNHLVCNQRHKWEVEAWTFILLILQLRHNLHLKSADLAKLLIFLWKTRCQEPSEYRNEMLGKHLLLLLVCQNMDDIFILILSNILHLLIEEGIQLLYKADKMIPDLANVLAGLRSFEIGNHLWVLAGSNTCKSRHYHGWECQWICDVLLLWLWLILLWKYLHLLSHFPEWKLMYWSDFLVNWHDEGLAYVLLQQTKKGVAIDGKYCLTCVITIVYFERRQFLYPCYQVFKVDAVLVILWRNIALKHQLSLLDWSVLIIQQ